MLRICFILVNILIFTFYSAYSQCADEANVYSFSYEGKNYEVVKENLTWEDASVCAVERGGYLAEINDKNEQNAIYAEIMDNAEINLTQTIAPDGGGASYLWLGGNDLGEEGKWVWDGDNSGDGVQFWQGKRDGNPVDDLYNNWGNEPDDFGQGQDGLGLALTNWPLGAAGQWNDVNENNQLYYVIEYDAATDVKERSSNEEIKLYPNPADEKINIQTGNAINSVTVYDIMGRNILEARNFNSELDISQLPKGIYSLKIESGSKIIFEKVVVE